MTSDHTDWPSRLLHLRRRLDLDQQQMGDRLGCTREWVSRLERGHGEFSEIIQLKIEEIEADATRHKGDSESRGVAEAAAPYDANAVAEQARQHLEGVLRDARGDADRLGWVLVQLREHVSTPRSWREGARPGKFVRVTLPSQTTPLSTETGKPLPKPEPSRETRPA